MTFQEDFKAAIARTGLTPPEHIKANHDGLTRFRSGSEKQKNGWYRLIILADKKGDEIAFGSFGCWKRSINEKWSSKHRDKFTQFDTARYKIEQERIRKANEEAAMNAAMRAQKIWERSKAPDKAHPYLVKKGIKAAIGIRQYGQQLVIPARRDGKIVTLQFIGESKLFLKGGKSEGTYCSIAGKDDPKHTFYICEGYATGATIYDAMKLPVVVAFSAGNIPPVVAFIRGKYPEAKIIIAADNDQWSKKPDGTPYNAGIEKALEAAQKYHAAVEYVRFDPSDPDRPTDFNDLYLKCGLSAVRAVLEGTPPDLRINAPATTEDTTPQAVEPTDWRNHLRPGKKTIAGYPIPFDGKSKLNALAFMAHHPRFKGIFSYNEFTDQILIVRCPPWEKPEGFAPRHAVIDDYLMLCAHLENVEISVSKELAIDLAHKVAHDNTINPPREYFDALQWDGKPRLDSWLTYYLGAEKQPAEYLKLVGRKWLCAGVARVYNPGCKFDNVLILEGPQGVGKSMALRTLATFNGVEYFADSVGDLKNKDTIMVMQGKIIIEMAELASFKKSENEEIKGFITRQVDEYRPPYGRLVVQRPRYFILAGSTNEQDEGYLTDRTGNRRYWPVLCGAIDFEALANNTQQLWAEAVYRYKQGEPLYLEKDDFDLATKEQKNRYIREAWTDKLREKLLGRWETTLSDAAEMLELKPKDITNLTRRRIKDALLEIGWFETRRDGERVWKSEQFKNVPRSEIEESGSFAERDLLL